MATITKQFDVKNGLSVANTIVLDSVRNLSNIASINVSTANVATLNVSSVENVATLNATSANIATANITSLQGLTISTVNALIVIANTQANYAATTANSAVANAAIANTNALVAYGQANSAYTQANLAYTQANAANVLANTANNTANAAYATANLAYATANAAGSGAGANALAAYAQANAAYAQANLAYGVANVANALAQNALPTTGGSLTGSLAIAGNLYVTGTTVTLNVGSLSTNDAIIYIASNNAADVVDMGIIGYETNATSVNVGTGLIRHATDNKWYLFDGYTDQGRNPTVNVANTFYATLVANVQALSITVGGNAVATAVNTNAAYTQANSAYTQANLAYTQANAANSLANTANNTANAAYAQANSGVFTQVNGIKINGPTGGSQNVYTSGVSYGGTGQSVIDSMLTNNFLGADYFITIANNSPGSGGLVIHTTKISIIQDGTNVLIDEFGTLATGPLLASFTATITGGAFQLLMTPTNQPVNGTITVYLTRFTT